MWLRPHESDYGASGPDKNLCSKPLYGDTVADTPSPAGCSADVSAEARHGSPLPLTLMKQEALSSTSRRLDRQILSRLWSAAAARWSCGTARSVTEIKQAAGNERRLGCMRRPSHCRPDVSAHPPMINKNKQYTAFKNISTRKHQKYFNQM